MNILYPSYRNKKEENRFQILTILKADLLVFISGASHAWQTPSTLALLNDHENPKSKSEISLLAIVQLIGGISSSILFCKSSDLIGRKYSLILSCSFYILSWLMITCSLSIYILFVARFIAGVGDSGVFIIIPMYFAEILTPKIRGTWGVTYFASLFLGKFSINALGSNMSISTTASIFLVFSIIFLLIAAFIPETPYYLLKKGQDDLAKASLSYLRGNDDIDQEFSEIKLAVLRQIAESGHWIDLFKIDSNRRALTSCLFLAISLEFIGTHALLVYNQYIFSNDASNLSPQLSSMITFFINGVAGLYASLTINRVGRKRSVVYSLLFISFFLLLETAYFYGNSFLDLSFWNWIPLAGLIGYFVSVSIGIGTVYMVMLGELFAIHIKGKALFIICNVYVSSTIVSLELFYVLENSAGIYGPLLFYTIWALMASILATRIVPETKGKTLEEIQIALRERGVI